MGALKHSYVHGVGAAPLRGTTVGELLDEAVATDPQRDALIAPYQGVRWSYRRLKHEADALAAGLVALGLTPGERLAIWAPNGAEWVVTQFASAKAGLVLVNVNPAYRLPELRHALSLTGCAALVTAPRFKSSDYLQMLRELLPELARCRPGALASEHLPSLRHVLTLGDETLPGALAFDDVAERASDADRARVRELAGQLQFDDPITIQFTSGTTGTPKAATLSHHNIVNNADRVAQTMELSAGDRLCIPVPLYHCFGMILGTLACVACGATMVLPSAGFDAGAMLETIAAERCTAVHGVPTMFIAALEHPSFPAVRLDTLRTGVIAGAPCATELMKRLVSEMHLSQITIAYGMTETGPVTFQTSVHDSVERRITTVGRVLPYTEVKIVDREGHVVPVGTPGELLARGYCVMRGYWNDPERSSEAIDTAGWMHSGDLAEIDAAGYCRIVGRIKDMLIRGGENIFPREIEEFLFTHPKVDDVHVIGVPDPRLGEEVCAWVKLRAGERCDADEIRDFCRGRLAHFKIPRYVRFVDQFPMTVSGKVQKFRMREMMVEALGLSEDPPVR